MIIGLYVIPGTADSGFTGEQCAFPGFCGAVFITPPTAMILSCRVDKRSAVGFGGLRSRSSTVPGGLTNNARLCAIQPAIPDPTLARLSLHDKGRCSRALDRIVEKGDTGRVVA